MQQKPDAGGETESEGEPVIPPSPQLAATTTRSFAPSQSVHGPHPYPACEESVVRNTAISLRGIALPVSVLFLCHVSPPAARAGVQSGGAGAETYVQADSTGMWMETDACDPDLQPFKVGLMGSLGTRDVALDVDVSNGFAYVADGLSGLQILNVGEPTAPTLVAGYDTPGYAQGVAVKGNYAYVADGEGGLLVVDVSSPSSPAPAGNCATGGFAYGVAVSGDYAYVGGGAGGLYVIDITDPTRPAMIGSHDVCSTAWGVAVMDDYAYVAGGASGLQIIDISSPLSPVYVGCYETRGTALGVTVSGGYAYVAGGASGLQIVTVSDPYAPMLTAKCEAPDFAYGVAVINNYAYVASGADGLQVLQAAATISLADPHSGPPTALSDPSDEPGGRGAGALRSNALFQNSPNPFTAATRIAFSTKAEAHVRLSVFDASGRLVRTLVDEERRADDYVEEWDGRDSDGRALAAGMYFCRVELPGWTDAKKMALTK